MNELLKRYIGIDQIIAVALYFIAFLRMPSSNLYGKGKHILLIMVVTYCLFYFPTIVHKYRQINFILVLFGGWTLLTSFINRSNVERTNPFYAAIFFVTALISIFVSLEILNARIGLNKLIDIFFKCAIFVVTAVDLYIFFGPVQWRGDGTQFIIGTKFAVMYQHLIFFWLLLEKTKNNIRYKKISYLFFLFLIFIGLKVDSVTGIVGGVIFLALLYLINNNKDKWVKPIVALIIQLAAFAYIFAGTFFMSNKYIYEFIENHLGGASTMMSRVSIYSIALNLMKLSPFVGFGYETTYEIGMQVSRFSNTQNSLFEWAWFAGWPATVLICAIIVIAFGYIKKGYDKRSYIDIYVVALMYLYMILGSIEILMQLPFFSILAVAMISGDNESVEQKN
jgi:hypothetical protein